MGCWQDVVEACTMCVNQKGNKHVVNVIEVTGVKLSPMHVPRVKNQALEGEWPDMEGHTVYHTLYQDIFKTIYGRLAPLYERLHEIYRK